MRFRLPKRIRHAAILGCGPAGLFAAHALARHGWTFDIYSRKRRSEMFGAQYLHAPIPGLPDVSTEIRYRLVGTVEGYRAKVYGANSTATVSPEVLSRESTRVWDIRAAYWAAWDRYVDRIVPAEIDMGWMLTTMAAQIAAHRYSVLISSVPLTSICMRELLGSPAQNHVFRSQVVWAIGDAPERGVFSPISAAPNEVVCNGLHDTGWYRLSNIFGHNTAEWPAERKPPLEGIASVTKPITTNCSCFESLGIVKVGRYGRWDKTELSHQAYNRALEAIQ